MNTKVRIVAFVAHSFAPEDRAVVDTIIGTIRRAKFSVLSGVSPEARGVSRKIKDRIERADLFVSVMTRRHKISERSWTTNPWVIEEKGYSLGQNPNRPIVVLVEEGIMLPEETGGLEGDLEYICFNRLHFEIAQKKLREILAAFRASLVR